jgi:hypothetical protein
MKTETNNNRANGTGKERPAHEIRLGRIKATIWANPQENGVRYTATCCRLYKDEENKWRSSDSFGREDVPLLCKVLDLAHTWMYQEQEGAV